MKLGDKLPFPLSLQTDYNRENVFLTEDFPKVSKSATKEEKAAIEKSRPSTSFFRDSIRRFVKNPVAMVSFVLMIVLVLVVIIMPNVDPYKYDQQLSIINDFDATYNYLNPFQYSATELAQIAAGQSVFPHLLGTDKLGRDYFARLLFGTSVSLFIGVFAAIIVLVIGTLYGSISGYAGGKVDLAMMRVVDVIYSLPDIMLIIIISVVLRQVLPPDNPLISGVGSGMIAIFIVFALLYWVGMARLVRGQVLSLKQQEYVLASRSIGGSASFVIRKHLLPNSMSVIIISAGLQVPSAIFTESFMSFLGLGINAPMASLGSLASEGEKALNSHPLLLFAPAIVISFIVLCLNLIGDGLRDAFDPRLQR